MFNGCTIGQLDETAMVLTCNNVEFPQKSFQSFIDVRILECCYREHQNTGIKTKETKIIANKLGVKIDLICNTKD
jgi:hypothetical protein